MIKIAHQNIETTMELNSCSPLVLSVENSKEFYNSTRRSIFRKGKCIFFLERR